MDHTPPKAKAGAAFATRMSHVGRAGTKIHGFVNPAVHRGATVLTPDCATRTEAWSHRYERYLTYGTEGNATHWALEDAVAEIEGGARCQIVPTGLAACVLALLSWARAGDHVLMPDSCYGPVRDFCDNRLQGWGISLTYYDPLISPEGLRALWQENTRILYTESPGSHTFELQDIPALAAVAHELGGVVMLDNTWGVHHFQPFTHGVDVSIQALTKYVGGHADLLLGAVTLKNEEDFRQVRDTANWLGYYASPDDCWLALRGARTMAVRLKQQAASGLEVARWLEAQPEVLTVRHPALPSHPQHALWKRDFTGCCSLFGVVLHRQYSLEDLFRVVDGLQLFGIGASWGGFESLALPTTGYIDRSVSSGDFGGPMVRLHIGLEEPADLIADLRQSLDQLAR